jgi:hypothetical protein
MSDNHNNFVTALIISGIFLVFKFIEMRYLLKKDIPLKLLLRDTLLVYISSVLGLFILEQINDTVVIKKTTSAFTDSPDF